MPYDKQLSDERIEGGTWPEEIRGRLTMGFNKFRAVILKGFQKLREPCEITIVD